MTSRTMRAVLMVGALCLCLESPLLAKSVFKKEKLAEMDQAIQEAIKDGRCPGGVLWLEHKGSIYHKAYGNRALVPKTEKMTEDTIFDAASLTKVVACTPAMMLLVERGEVNINDPVEKYIPEFKGEGKHAITIKHLMTHTSGLPPDIETKTDWQGQKTAIEKACAEKLQSKPGTALRYSDINMFLVGEIVQRVSKMPLEEFVKKNVYDPLGMKDTGYLPPKSKITRIAPTEVVKGVPWRGTVHDPTARHMGGVAGHAGLFFTAADLAKYARMLLGEGTLNGVQILKPETVKMMTAVQTPDTVRGRRGLGWDIDSSYSGPRGKLFPLGSYGHTGWTGTSIWIDPFSQTFIIFLSNRNHPSETGNVGPLRSKLATLAAEAITDFDFEHVAGTLAPRPDDSESGPAADRRSQRPSGGTAKVYRNLHTLSGLDVLEREKFAPLKGLKVALITNHTGHDRERNPTIDLLFNAPDVELKFLFSPEHGIRGEVDEKVGDSYDTDTGLPIYSLYGKANKPTSEQLTNVDALVFDIQDVGCRFYTYTSTMGLTLEAAGQNHKKYFVLDRPDPINAVSIEGPVRKGKGSFVAFHTVPLRYGMTIGELAQMFNEERDVHAELTVIKMENWKRNAWFDETGLPWSNQSPNMRNFYEALLYPGIGLLERALSVGRGTDTPFELVGAPYINDVQLADELNKAGLEGVRFNPIRFTPKSSIHRDKQCNGVSIVVTDRERVNSVDVGLQIAKTLYRLYPKEFSLKKISHLLLHDETLDALRDDKSLSQIHEIWEKDLAEFKARRAKFLIYE